MSTGLADAAGLVRSSGNGGNVGEVDVGVARVRRNSGVALVYLYRRDTRVVAQIGLRLDYPSGEHASEVMSLLSCDGGAPTVTVS